jgi:predicted ATP-grasp superfamily ATP-dependent carboligase
MTPDTVLLVNANNNVALTIARGLGSRGVPVVGVGWPEGGVGMSSRHLRQRIWIDGHRDLTADRLRDIVEATGARYVMAMGEDVLTHLNTLRSSLPSGVTYLFPPQHILERAFDKTITLDYAARLGIDCPRTFEPASLASLAGGLAGFGYPVVMKFARATAGRLPAALTFPYRYAFSRDEVLDVLRPYERYGIFPLIQEYIPGRSVGIEVCLRDGNVAAAFQHERIHELPITGGPAVYRRSVPLNAALFDRAVALLRALEWEGVAMVEFRQVAPGGRASLMEVNGRFWGSLPLALEAGVNFPYVLYETMGRRRELKPQPYRIDVRVKQLGPHLKWFWNAFVSRPTLPPEGFMSRGRVLLEFLGSFSPRVRFDIETWDDPMPAVRHWGGRIARLRPALPYRYRQA